MLLLMDLSRGPLQAPVVFQPQRRGRGPGHGSCHELLSFFMDKYMEALGPQTDAI